MKIWWFGCEGDRKCIREQNHEWCIKGWVIGAGFEGVVGRAGKGGRGRAGHLKRKFTKKKRWGVGNKRETEGRRRCQRRRCDRGAMHKIRARRVIPGAAWQERSKWIRERGVNVGWREEVKKLEDKAGEQKKEGTDENAGQVIIPPTSFVPWITVLDTHMHAQEIDVEPGVIRLGPVCSSVGSLFSQPRLVYSLIAVPPLSVSTSHNTTVYWPNCMSKFRAIILEKQQVREHNPTVN